jgi:DNA-binding CsgD family transcriptional regulator
MPNQLSSLGRSRLSPEASGSAAADYAACLQLTADGVSVTEMANLLSITPSEVEDLLDRARQELGGVTLTHAVAIGIRSQLIE